MPGSPKSLAAAMALAMVLTMTSCNSGGAIMGSGEVVLDAHPVGRVGTALVVTGGFALYVFLPDEHSRVTCVSRCAEIWPPLQLAPHGRIVTGPGVDRNLVATVPDPGGGGRVVTYDGWPLYRYISDTAPYEAAGQGLNLNGGPWYVMAPTGQPLIPRSASG